MFVARDAVWPKGRDPRSYYFLGKSEGASYTYRIFRDADGTLNASGEVVRPLLSEFMLDRWIQPGLREADNALRTINCSTRQPHCVLTVWRAWIGDSIEFFTVEFNAQWKAGNLCIFVPLANWSAPLAKVTVYADKKAVVTAALPNTNRVNHCLGADSGRVLDAFRKAADLQFEIGRADSDRRSLNDFARLDPEGLIQSLSLTRFLYERVIVSQEREAAQAKIKPKADALIDGKRE